MGSVHSFFSGLDYIPTVLLTACTLMEKGLFTEVEFLTKMKQVQMDYQRKGK